MESSLRTSPTELKPSVIRRLMDKYFDEARISLLFLRKIRSIDFRIQERRDAIWSITRQPPLDEDANTLFSEIVICSFHKDNYSHRPIIGKDKWCVVIQDLDLKPEHSNDGSRVTKSVECGLAALLHSKLDGISPLKPIRPRIFNILPLPIDSDLPVHVHATFSLSGDRQSIAIDGYGAKSDALLNRYFLKDALPALYLQFLEEIGRQVRQRVFEYWPQENSKKKSPSELLCASFWEKLPESSRQLFPKTQMIDEQAKRQAVNLFTFSDAVFDFLPETESKVLLPLLMSLRVNLVHKVPIKVAKHLKELSNVKSLSGPILRELLKSKESRLQLQKQMIKCPSILEVLVRQLTRMDESLENLDGCYILPLANGEIAALKYLNTSDSKTSNYYVIQDRHLELFRFASRQLVTSTSAEKLGPVLESGNFNLEKLQLCHVNKLMDLMPPTSIADPERDRWLVNFWKFWNQDEQSLLPSSKVDLFPSQIFKATCNGVQIYTSPIEFHQLPAVIKPSIGKHQQICDTIPGLYVFDPKYMPQSLADNEDSFNKEASFFRLILALKILANQDGMSSFISSHLESSHIKVTLPVNFL